MAAAFIGRIHTSRKIIHVVELCVSVCVRETGGWIYKLLYSSNDFYPL